MDKKAGISTYFSTMKDHRLDRKRKHDMLDIIAITIAAVVCGAEDWYEIEEFAVVNESWFKTFLPLENGMPSHDTINRFFANMDPATFESCFTAWISSLEGITRDQLVSIDGKTIRGAKENGKKSPVHMVSAWADKNGLVLGQLRVREKSNEITAIPELLNALFLKDCLVSIDAMGCQLTIAGAIVDKECDYLLAVKGNQGELQENVLDSFRFFKPDDTVTDNDIGHGRVETRTCTVIKDLGHISQKEEWTKLATLIRIESERFFKASETTETETRYYISSKNESAVYFQRNIRSHWGIENKLHWMLDVIFMRIKAGKGQVMPHKTSPSSTKSHLLCSKETYPQPEASRSKERKQGGTEIILSKY